MAFLSDAVSYAQCAEQRSPDPTVSDVESDTEDLEEQPKPWFWKRAWNAIPTVGSTMKEFRKTAEEVVKNHN